MMDWAAGCSNEYWALTKRKPHMDAIEEACELIKDPEDIPGDRYNYQEPEESEEEEEEWSEEDEEDERETRRRLFAFRFNTNADAERCFWLLEPWMGAGGGAAAAAGGGTPLRKMLGLDAAIPDVHEEEERAKQQQHGGQEEEEEEDEDVSPYVLVKREQLESNEPDGGSNNSDAQTQMMELDRTPATQREHEAWVRCMDCNKWRRVPQMMAEAISRNLAGRWTCEVSTQRHISSCEVPQELLHDEIHARIAMGVNRPFYDDDDLNPPSGIACDGEGLRAEGGKNGGGDGGGGEGGELKDGSKHSSHFEDMDRDVLKSIDRDGGSGGGGGNNHPQMMEVDRATTTPALTTTLVPTQGKPPPEVDMNERSDKVSIAPEIGMSAVQHQRQHQHQHQHQQLNENLNSPPPPSPSPSPLCTTGGIAAVAAAAAAAAATLAAEQIASLKRQLAESQAETERLHDYAAGAEVELEALAEAAGAVDNYTLWSGGLPLGVTDQEIDSHIRVMIRRCLCLEDMHARRANAGATAFARTPIGPRLTFDEYLVWCSTTTPCSTRPEMTHTRVTCT